MNRLLVTGAIAMLLAGTSQATRIDDYTVVTASSPFGGAASRVGSAQCPPGTDAIGGGADTIAGGGARPVLERSEPIVGTVEGWTASAVDEEPEEAGGWRLVVTAICANVAGLTRDTFEMTSFALRKSAIAGCPVDEVAISGGARGFDTGGSVLQRSIQDDPNTWGGTVRASNPDFTLRVIALCIPDDDDIMVLGLSSTTSATPTKEISVVCPQGSSVLGGGAEAFDDEEGEAALTTSAPLFDDGTIIGWRAAGHVRYPTEPPWRLDVRVTCPEPAHAPIAVVALAWRARRLRGAASTRGAA